MLRKKNQQSSIFCHMYTCQNSNRRAQITISLITIKIPLCTQKRKKRRQQVKHHRQRTLCCTRNLISHRATTAQNLSLSAIQTTPGQIMQKLCMISKRRSFVLMCTYNYNYNWELQSNKYIFQQ